MIIRIPTITSLLKIAWLSAFWEINLFDTVNSGLWSLESIFWLMPPLPIPKIPVTTSVKAHKVKK